MSLPISILLIISSVAFYAQIISPQIEYAKFRNQQLKETVDVFNRINEIKEKRDEINREFSLIPDEKKRLIQNITPIETLESRAQFFVDFEKLLRDSGVPRNREITVRQSRDDDSGLIVLPVRLKTEISFNALRIFVQNVQSWSRAVVIRSISIEGKADETNPNQSIIIDIDVLFSKSII